MLTTSHVVATGLACSRSALSEVNGCGAKPFEIPLIGVLKLANYRSAFLLCIFQTHQCVGHCWEVFCITLVWLQLWGFFHLKHYSIPLVHEDMELMDKSRWVSQAVAQYCGVWGTKGVHTWMDGSLCWCYRAWEASEHLKGG